MLAACNSQPSPSAVKSLQPAAATDNTAPSKFPSQPDNEAPPAQLRSADAEAAAAVLRRYYAALEARDYQTAYTLWSDQGKASKQSLDAFQAGFAATRTTSLQLDQPGVVEGAAGSLYVSIPVSVDAELNDGTSQHFSGSYVLRRVNDVEGSSLEERRWHIYSAALRASSPK